MSGELSWGALTEFPTASRSPLRGGSLLYTERVAAEMNRDEGKAEWRRWAKATRAQLDIPVLSQVVQMQLERHPLYRRAEHVLTYLAFGDELSLSGLAQKQFYATRTREDGTLTVHALAGKLERHPYGFDEPSADSPEVALTRLELILVPGLAFDRSGTRLGYGKGFYDRLLADVLPGVPVVGVVPESLIVETLPRAPHDVPVTHLMSEHRIYEVGWNK